MVIHGEGRQRSAACNSLTEGEGRGGPEVTGAFTRDKKAQEEGIGEQDGRWSEGRRCAENQKEGDGATAECFKGMIKATSHQFIHL